MHTAEPGYKHPKHARAFRVHSVFKVLYMIVLLPMFSSENESEEIRHQRVFVSAGYNGCVLELLMKG